jgi:hypothetical protein
VTRYLPDGEQRTTDVLAIGRDAWSRGRQSTPSDERPICWIHHDVTELFTNGLLVRNGDIYTPAPVTVAARGRGASSTDADQVSGTSELSTVLSVVDLPLPAALGISRTADHRVPATFTVDDGVLGGWTVFVRDAIEEARRVGEDATAAGTRGASTLHGMGASITTELVDQGDDVAIEAPASDEVVEYAANPDELTRRLEDCQ